MHTLHESSPHLFKKGRTLRQVQASPKVIGPVLEGTGGVDARGASMYGSVIHEDGVFRMWYQAWPDSDFAHDSALVGYAESDDGLTWRKPSLNLVEVGGTKANNIVPLRLHSPSVFVDKDAPPSHRYRATGFYKPAAEDKYQRGYHTAHSPDGLHWQFDSTAPRWAGSDVMTSCWDEASGGAVIALKRMVTHGGVSRRFSTSYN
jgi:hypothetical protein